MNELGEAFKRRDWLCWVVALALGLGFGSTGLIESICDKLVGGGFSVVLQWLVEVTLIGGVAVRSRVGLTVSSVLSMIGIWREAHLHLPFMSLNIGINIALVCLCGAEVVRVTRVKSLNGKQRPIGGAPNALTDSAAQAPPDA